MPIKQRRELLFIRHMVFTFGMVHLKKLDDLLSSGKASCALDKCSYHY